MVFAAELPAEGVNVPAVAVGKHRVVLLEDEIGVCLGILHRFVRRVQDQPLLVLLHQAVGALASEDRKPRIGPRVLIDADQVELRFDLLADLCGIDMNTPTKRFGVIYNLYSYTNKYRIRLKIFTEEEHPKVPTVTGVWGTANWHERETFDMFGIIFEGHPDLRRMYMPDEFEYHPLRKDFPLMGIRGSLDLPKK